MMLYRPSPSVTAVRAFSISTGLAASTVTPGRTAPEVSFTTPVMDDWENAGTGTRATHVSTVATQNSLRIPHLLPFGGREWRQSTTAGNRGGSRSGPRPAWAGGPLE